MPRHLIDLPLRVDDSLVGAALASPVRRGLAFAVDGMLLFLPTVATTVLAAALSLSVSNPQAFRAVRTLFTAARGDETTRRAAACDLVPVLVHAEARGVPAEVVAAVENGDLRRACQAMESYEITIELSSGADRNPRPREVVLQAANLVPPGIRVLALFGVPALYFVWCTRSRRGATIGKRLFGIRVTRLDGEHLSWLESLERFIGYVHIPATLFLGLADLWRDPNRRLAHDRSVHTAVFRVRRSQAAPVGAAAPRPVDAPAEGAANGTTEEGTRPADSGRGAVGGDHPTSLRVGD